MAIVVALTRTRTLVEAVGQGFGLVEPHPSLALLLTLLLRSFLDLTLSTYLGLWASI